MLRIHGLTKIYQTADGHAGGIRQATFEAKSSEFYTLLGPSGCGKTTTLRAIAGLEEPDAGVIEIGNRCVFDSRSGKAVALNDRGIGMVFQSYAVWPHMTVFQNVAFPLKAHPQRRYSSVEIRQRVRHTLEVVGLAGYDNRPAPMLSGGQQQRLALARALVAEPHLLLFDEPLSNLDAQLRDQMREELRRLQRELAITALYVTHDQAEALAMSDQIAVINEGRIVQTGSPTEIYHQPNSLFVATFIGKTNLISCVCPSGVKPGETILVETPAGSLRCKIFTPIKQGQPISISVRPEDVTLSRITGNNSGMNEIRGRVVKRVFFGEINEYQLRLPNGTDFLARGRFDADIDGAEENEIRFPIERTLGLSDMPPSDFKDE